MGEFGLKKNSGMKEQTLTIDKDGNPKATKDFGTIPPYQNALEVGKAPYFLKISKIRKIIYTSEGLCSLKAYRLWRNDIYKAVCAEALARGCPTRLLTSAELEAVDRFFWNNVFDTSGQQNIFIVEAIGDVFFTSRLAIELLPKPNVASQPAPSGWGASSQGTKTQTKNFLNPMKTNQTEINQEWPNITSRGMRTTVRIANSGISNKGGSRPKF